MGSLKEIKGRIQSVKSTEKITSAMKMVSSAKLRKAEKVIESMIPYEHRLTEILTHFLHTQEEDLESPYSQKRVAQRVAIVAFASNSSLCGSFNSNAFKMLQSTIDSYTALSLADFDIYTVGKKITQACERVGIQPVRSYDVLAEKPEYDPIRDLTDHLSQRFLDGKIDRVKFVHHEYISKGKQLLKSEQLLPIKLNGNGGHSANSVYLLEPDSQSIYLELVPKLLRTKLYKALLDSNASEHAARMMAMQSASDNARELIDDLTLEYNKTRQQAITAELLDILGGSL